MNEQREHPEVMLTDKQVGVILGVTRKTVWKWSGAKIIPGPYRVSSQARWKQSEITAYLEGLERAEVLEKAS